MFEVALSFWASVTFTIYWLEIARMPERIRILDFKPINCEACLPVWLTPIFYGLAVYSHIASEVIAASFTAGIITPLLLKQIRK